MALNGLADTFTTFQRQNSFLFCTLLPSPDSGGGMYVCVCAVRLASRRQSTLCTKMCLPSAVVLVPVSRSSINRHDRRRVWMLYEAKWDQSRQTWQLTKRRRNRTTGDWAAPQKVRQCCCRGKERCGPCWPRWRRRRRRLQCITALMCFHQRTHARWLLPFANRNISSAMVHRDGSFDMLALSSALLFPCFFLSIFFFSGRRVVPHLIISRAAKRSISASNSIWECPPLSLRLHFQKYCLCLTMHI